MRKIRFSAKTFYDQCFTTAYIHVRCLTLIVKGPFKGSFSSKDRGANKNVRTKNMWKTLLVTGGLIFEDGIKLSPLFYQSINKSIN